MAGSRTFTNTCNGNHGSHYTQTLIVNWSDYDISNNRTYVSISYQRSTANQSYWNNYGYANPSQISVDGSQVASATPYSAHNTQVTQTLCTWEGWIYHNNDGTKSINVGASFSSSSSNLSGGSVSGTVQLPTIPRASSISATSVDIGSNTTITINKANNSFTHTITYSFGNLTGTIATKTSNTSLSWTVPTTFYAQIPNAKNGTCTLTCKTYNGDTHIGTSTTTFVATANEELCKPDLTVDVEDINDSIYDLTGDRRRLVKYRSYARVTTSSTPKNSATISKVTINGVEGAMVTFQKVETKTFEVIVTDSRGYQRKVTDDLCTLIEYIPLSASSLFKRVSNTSNKVNLTYSGNYWNGDFGVENNSLTLSYKYREKGSSTWIDGTSTLNPTITNNKFNVTIELAENFNYRKNWEFSLFYEDELTSANTGINDVLKGAGALEVYDSAVKVNGDIIVNGDIKYHGNSIVEYSTNEIIVGKWIDSKPIYRKVLSGTTGNNDYEEIYTITNLDTLINLYGNSGTQYKGTPNCVNLHVTPQQFTQFGLNGNKIICNKLPVAELPYKIIIEYTKTTD